MLYGTHVEDARALVLYESPRSDFGAAFDVASERRERARAARDVWRKRLENQLLPFKHVCVACVAFDGDCEGHKHLLFNCDVKRQFGLDGYFAFSRSIEYKGDYTTRLCFQCHVPEFDKVFHPPSDKADRTTCPWFDIVLPVVFMGLTGEDATRRKAHAALKLTFPSADITAWSRWLSAPSMQVQAPYTTNVLRAFDYFVGQGKLDAYRKEHITIVDPK